MSKKNNDDFEILNFENIYSNSEKDIFSGYEDISSSSRPKKSEKVKKKKKKKKRIFLKLITSLLCIAIILGAGFYFYAYNLVDKIERTSLDSENLGITSSRYSSVKNIALLGLDTRDDNKTGRSDAIVIVTVDKANRKIKLTSIARDSYVSIEGHKKDKLTHAYAYGKSQLAVKTLNQNFGLEITDYVTMNFFELARIIDYIGGVTLDVSEEEFKELNSYVIPTTDFGDIPCEYLKSAGVQKLTGAQAVCYARIRHTDGDIERGNRQKEVLTAMFSEVKSLNPLKLPELANMVLQECETSLDTKSIMDLGLWAVFSAPEFEQLSIPNDNVPAKGMISKGAWIYSYNLDDAKKEINDFIFEKNYYSPEEVEKRKEE